MKKLFSAAIRGIRAELAAGESGWVVVDGVDLSLSDVGTVADSGALVSNETIMKLSAVWACASATSQLVASLPCHLYEKTKDGKKNRIDAEAADIMFAQPNAMQTGVEFWEGFTVQQLLRGNAYAEKLKIGARTVGYRPLFNVTPRRVSGAFEYVVIEKGKRRVLTADQVLHLRGFGAGNGLGLSVVKYGVQSFGAALSADQTAAKVFSNALMPSGVLEADQSLSPEQRTQLQTNLEAYAGSSRAGKTMVLEAGLKWNQVQWDPEDVQLLGTRRFQVEDICRWFGTPPVVIGHASEGQTMWGTGIESIMLSWLRLGINPILRRNEARLNLDAIPPERRGKWFYKYNREAMLEMDSKAKAEFLSRMATSGTMTANERREKLNLPRHDDPLADELLAQTALAPLIDLRKDAE
jgi:HK97 family phage portal protein